jgi:GNAT superfamily N-acetyltransferase
MPITTTYLQMLTHHCQHVPPPMAGITIRHVTEPTVEFYRQIYDAVGGKWNWSSRKKLPDAELARIIGDPRVEIHLLLVDEKQAGFAELDRRQPSEIELVQFGLVAKFIGRRLGKYFLQRVIDKAFGYEPQRFWLHTCTEDHPAALPNYLKAGFAIYASSRGAK